MAVLIAYLVAKGLLLSLAVYMNFDALSVGASEVVADVQRRSFTWRFCAALWGLLLAALTVEDLILKALSRIL